MRLLISDLHLEDSLNQRTHALVSLLEHHAAQITELYILGDLFNIWIGDDHLTPCAQQIACAISKLPWVGWIYGNRDYMLGKNYCDKAGMTWLDEPYLTKFCDTSTILCHGDVLCTDDHAHQQARARFTDADYRATLLQKSIQERLAMANDYRNQSERRKQYVATEIMDVNQQAVETLMAKYQAGLLIHGHTHKPGIYQQQHGKRLVLGDWTNYGWYLAERNQRLELVRFPIPYNPAKEACVASYGN